MCEKAFCKVCSREGRYPYRTSRHCNRYFKNGRCCTMPIVVRRPCQECDDGEPSPFSQYVGIPWKYKKRGGKYRRARSLEDFDRPVPPRRGHEPMGSHQMGPMGPGHMGPPFVGSSPMGPHPIGPPPMDHPSMGPSFMEPSPMGPSPMGPASMTPSFTRSSPMSPTPMSLPPMSVHTDSLSMDPPHVQSPIVEPRFSAANRRPSAVFPDLNFMDRRNIGPFSRLNEGMPRGRRLSVIHPISMSVEENEGSLIQSPPMANVVGGWHGPRNGGHIFWHDWEVEEAPEEDMFRRGSAHSFFNGNPFG